MQLHRHIHTLLYQMPKVVLVNFGSDTNCTTLSIFRYHYWSWFFGHRKVDQILIQYIDIRYTNFKSLTQFVALQSSDSYTSKLRTYGCTFKKYSGAFIHVCFLRVGVLSGTISLDDFKNLWQYFEKLLFSVNDYDFALPPWYDVNA